MSERDYCGVHVYPLSEIDDHTYDSTDCRCEPEVEWMDPDTGLPYPHAPLVVHRPLSCSPCEAALRRRAESRQTTGVA